MSLTEHRRAGLLRCHYCDFTTPDHRGLRRVRRARARARGRSAPSASRTPSTHSFPGARVGRLDRDTAAGRGVEEVLERMRTRELDILVGTQMVTKGHDLPGVTLVGVLLADQSLAFPDFRAAERTFQLLAQVAGRAGRGERPGRVLLQTYQPDALRGALRAAPRLPRLLPRGDRGAARARLPVPAGAAGRRARRRRRRAGRSPRHR